MKLLLRKPMSPMLTTKHSVIYSLKKDRYAYLMLVPVLIWYCIFSYVPMHGVVIAFQKYSIGKGVFGSSFIGFENFSKLLNDQLFVRAFQNTLVINALRILFGFPIPILFSMLLYEIRHTSYKRVVQTFTYLPHFVSWVVLAGIFNSLLSLNSGVVNVLLKILGMKQQAFLTDTASFRTLLIIGDIWKETGWNSIIYLAAIASIDPTIYEAAVVDGANRFKRAIYITLPCIRNTMSLMLILLLGRIMSMGFDQIFNMYTPPVYEVADILDTYITRNLMEMPNFGILGAASLIRSVINLVILLLANRGAQLLNGEGIY